jgi:uncharacterized alkaline shock family protein YloU
MSTDTLGPAGSATTTSTASTTARRQNDDHGGSGRTTIADSVVEKIASLAVLEIDEVGGVAARVLGLPIGSDGKDRNPKVSARVDGSIVTLDVRLSVTYPAPIGRVTQQVREHVIDRISTLTGLSTRQVDITVTALHQHHIHRSELT